MKTVGRKADKVPLEGVKCKLHPFLLHLHLSSSDSSLPVFSLLPQGLLGWFAHRSPGSVSVKATVKQNDSPLGNFQGLLSFPRYEEAGCTGRSS